MMITKEKADALYQQGVEKFGEIFSASTGAENYYVISPFIGERMVMMPSEY